MQETRHPAFLQTLRALLAIVMLAALFSGVGVRAAEPDGPRMVIPLGQTAGIKLFSDGVLVVGFSEIATGSGTVSPAKEGGLKEGDVITRMDGEPVSSIERVQEILQEREDRPLPVEVLRDGDPEALTVQAVRCRADGAYKLGAWIRDSMAGIGTLTFADPETGRFGTLGHGVNDVDTAVLMKLQSGSVTPASVAGVVKGQDGKPGELRGAFRTEDELGTLYANTERGVFGHLTAPETLSGKPIPVAEADQVRPGNAVILANVSGTAVEEYTVEILKVYDHALDARDLMLRITDPRLLERTGGIVQGMSGSPILQDGRLAGAVTHVLIDHADRGYGILACHMLEEAEARDKPAEG